MSKWITNPRFIKTAVFPKDYPTIKNDQGQLLPEVAVVGRSNVGKSSLLNHLFQKKSLVKTSAQPGKTQAINFFQASEELLFVDLPGYGYAKVPMKIKEQWGPMVQGYLENRDPLRLILFLLDVRRLPNEDDRLLLEWIAHANKPAILIFTKIDKLNQSERHHQKKRILEALDHSNFPHMEYTIKTGRCRKQLEEILNKEL